MAPPEVILDRWIRTQARNTSEFSQYLGKLDVEQVGPSSLRSFLYIVQETMNEALRLEGVNASGGVKHPPFHFDYLDVRNEIKNAHAFQYENFAFIVVTLPLVRLIWELSERLSGSLPVQQMLGANPGVVDCGALKELLFQIQLNFLISHEYAHHIHQDFERQRGVVGVWTEFPQDGRGTIDFQAGELHADGFAVYLVLAHLLRGELRPIALEELGRTYLTGADGDELLLMCFFLAVLAFFCALWRENTDVASVFQLSHPPPPVRIKYAINVAEMWCGQNGSVPRSWFEPARLQALFRSAAAVFGERVRQSWDAHMSFLRSPQGGQYDRQLFERFEAVRKNPSGLAHPA